MTYSSNDCDDSSALFLLRVTNSISGGVYMSILGLVYNLKASTQFNIKDAPNAADVTIISVRYSLLKIVDSYF